MQRTLRRQLDKIESEFNRKAGEGDVVLCLLEPDYYRIDPKKGRFVAGVPAIDIHFFKKRDTDIHPSGVIEAALAANQRVSSVVKSAVANHVRVTTGLQVKVH